MPIDHSYYRTLMGIRTALSAGNDQMALSDPAKIPGGFVHTMLEQGLNAAIDQRRARWGDYTGSRQQVDDAR